MSTTILFRTIRRVAVICSLYISSAYAGTLYIADKGTGDGLTDATPQSADYFNAKTSWGTAAGQIGPGTVVHLVGTLTKPLLVQGSGTANQPITILFDRGARLSRPQWNQGGKNGDAAIYMTGVQYVTVDGGADGLIEATDNGTSRTYQLNNCGVRVDYSSHVTVQNLTVRNMYVRDQGPDTKATANCIRIFGQCDNVTVAGCKLYEAVSLVFVAYEGSTNIEVRDCRGAGAGEGCVVLGAKNTLCTLTGVKIHHNDFAMTLAWSGYSGIHKNIVHAHAVQADSSIKGLEIFANRFSGAMGDNATSFCFLEGYIYGAKIYNNVLAPDNGTFTGNGYVTIKGTDRTLVANNTFIGQDAGVAIGTTTFGALGTNLRIKNNLILACRTGIYDPVAMTTECDFNDYANVTYFQYATGLDKLAGWKTETRFDANSTTAVPFIDNVGALTDQDVVAADAGNDLSPEFQDDFAGNHRPAGNAWDIGAFERIKSSTGTSTAAPAPASNTGLPLGVRATLTVSP